MTTDEFLTQLSHSEAVRSMRMEVRVQCMFQKLRWRTMHSSYYEDISTGKSREIDVQACGVFYDRKRFNGTAAPLLNVDILVECKSLHGKHIIFSKDRGDGLGNSELYSFWVGNSECAISLTNALCESLEIRDQAKKSHIYKYVTSRTHPINESAIAARCSLWPETIDFAADSFREVTFGASAKSNADDKIAPLWSAIQATMSALEYGKERAKYAGTDWIYNHSRSFLSQAERLDLFCFFLDAEVMRRCFFHPIVILNANMWALDGGAIAEVKMVRLHLNKFRGARTYVDIISEDVIEDYIKKLSRSIYKQSRRLIKSMWEDIELLGWEPGQRAGELTSIIENR